MSTLAPIRLPRVYEGPECPRCKARLTADWIRSGIVTCPDCRRDFEATAFHPPAPRLHVAEVTMTPEGANACANHARNAAVTSCQRCGLFICALCEINVGQGSYCPSCYEHLRQTGDKGVSPRYRDYASMARICVAIGALATFMWGLGAIFGVAALVYCRKGLPQVRSEGRSTVGLRIVSIIAMFEIVGGLGMLTLMIMTVTGAFQ